MSAGPILTLGLGAFTGGGVRYLPTLGFGTDANPPPPDEDFSASNWQRWSRKKLEDGELPPVEQAEAQEAVREAQAASVEQARATDDQERRTALLRAMEAREAFENAYREAYGEAYVAEIVSELWRKEMRRVERRRKAAILLLH